MYLTVRYTVAPAGQKQFVSRMFEHWYEKEISLPLKFVSSSLDDVRLAWSSFTILFSYILSELDVYILDFNLFLSSIIV